MDRLEKAWLTPASLALTLCVVLAGALPAFGQERARRVLLLYPYDNAVPATNLAGEAARKRLLERGKKQIEIFIDFLDLVRFPDETHGQRTARFLAEKYAQTPFDLVIALNTESLRFATRHRHLFAANVPIVFCCVTRAVVDAATRPNDITGIVSEYDLTRTVELARRLQPNARNLVYIGGASEIDRRWAETYSRQLRPYEELYNTTYLVGLVHEDLLRRVAQLSRDTIVLIGPTFTDGAGRQFVPLEATEEIARTASAPSYGNVDPSLGRGIVGGHMASFTADGSELADLALEILAGADPRAIAPRTTSSLQYRVDAQQLQRWGLSEKNLPEGTIVAFRQPTLWEQHRNVVIITIAVIVFQAGLITALLIQIFRRRRVEHAMQVAQSELARVTRLTTMGEMTASIAHEVNQPLAAIVANSDAGLRWLGNPTPNLDEAKAAFRRVTQEGHRAAEVIATVRAMFKKDAQARARIDVNKLVSDVLALVQGELQGNNISARISLADGVPLVHADRVQLQQVILNLTMNATEALAGISDRERVLRIRSELQGAAEILLSIEDNGPGIAPDSVDRVFEAFYTTKAHGMGMGLSICRSIVESHGGRLSASQGRPHGAVFQVALPIEARDEPLKRDEPCTGKSQ
jgi:signal transduction histidine kinase